MSDDFFTYKETLAAQTERTKDVSNHKESYRYITNAAELRQAIKPLIQADVFAFDTETTGLNPHVHTVRLLQIAAQSQPTLVIDLWAIADLSPIQELFQSAALKVAHNLAFDWMFLHSIDVQVTLPVFDTVLGYKVLQAGIPKSAKLAHVANDLLGVTLDKQQQSSDFSKQALSQEQIEYAARDATYCLRVFFKLKNRLTRKSKLWKANLRAIAELESTCAISTAWITLNGIRLDKDSWETAISHLAQKSNSALTEFHAALGEATQNALFCDVHTTLGTNPASTLQVKKALAKQGIALKSTQQRELVKYNHHPAVAALTEWRKANKTLEIIKELPSYCDKTSRIHADIFQMGARSGRYSFRNPPLQTMPRQEIVRHCFTAEPGNVLIRADYSQIELRIIAKLTRDPALVNAYQTGQDVHKMTASLLLNKPVTEVTHEERILAKCINFGLIYGMSAVRLQLEAQLNYGIVISHKQALNFHKQFFVKMEGVARWHRKKKQSLFQNNLTYARTLLGRVRQWETRPSFTEFVNFPVQGTSADLTKMALAKLIPNLSRTIQLVLIVHDEIVIEVPEQTATKQAKWLENCMVETAAPTLHPIPVIVETKIATTWG
jgi:DNA polymerase-1